MKLFKLVGREVFLGAVLVVSLLKGSKIEMMLYDVLGGDVVV